VNRDGRLDSASAIAISARVRSFKASLLSSLAVREYAGRGKGRGFGFGAGSSAGREGWELIMGKVNGDGQLDSASAIAISARASSFKASLLSS
jgi:hypothetical protein